MSMGTEDWCIQYAIDECILALGKHEAFFPPGRPQYITFMYAYTVNIIGYAKTIASLNESDKYSCIPLICRSLLELYADLKNFFNHQDGNIDDVVRLQYLRDMLQSRNEYHKLKTENKINGGKCKNEIDSYINTFERWLDEHFDIKLPNGLPNRKRSSWIIDRIEDLKEDYLSRYTNVRELSKHVECALRSNKAYKDATGQEFADADKIYTYLSSEIHSIISVVDKRATSKEGVFSFDQPTIMTLPSLGLTYWCVMDVAREWSNLKL